MRISQQIVWVILASILCGLVALVSIQEVFRYTEKKQTDYHRLNQIMMQAKHVEEAFSQWFVTIDLLLTQRQTYLIDAIKNQENYLSQQINGIDHEVPDVLADIKAVSNQLNTFAYDQGSGFVLDGTIKKTDALSSQIFQRWNVYVTQLAKETQTLSSDLISSKFIAYVVSISVFVLYVVALIVIWRLAVSHLVRPIVKLNEFISSEENGDIQVLKDLKGPYEIQCFSEQFSHYLISLKEAESEISKQLEEVKRTRAQLVKSEKLALIGTMTAGVAHELNNPVSIAKSNVQILSEYFDEIDQCKELLERVVPKSSVILKNKKLQHIIDDSNAILDTVNKNLVRIGAIVRDFCNVGLSGQNEKRLVSLNEIVKQTVKIAMKSAGSKIRIHLMEGCQAGVVGSAGAISKAIYNILDNSVKAIEDYGDVYIEIKPDDKRVNISVMDTGVGIDREHISKIFDPFFTTRTVGEGAGLGLHNTREIISELSGDVVVNSVVGKGTTIMLSIPTESISEITHQQAS